MPNIQRSRGYSFEHSIFQKIEAAPFWHARRLGGTSTGLPDIVATNNKTGTLLTIECKSSAGNDAIVPKEEIDRCKIVNEVFGYYPNKRIILAFKFSQKTKKDFRKQRFYFKAFGSDDFPENYGDLLYVKCNYNGWVTLRTTNRYTIHVIFDDYEMPFQYQKTFPVSLT